MQHDGWWIVALVIRSGKPLPAAHEGCSIKCCIAAKNCAVYRLCMPVNNYHRTTNVLRKPGFALIIFGGGLLCKYAMCMRIG